MQCRLLYTWHTSNRVSRNLIQLTRRLFRGLDHSLAVDDVSVYIYTHMKTMVDTGLINSRTHSRYRFPGLRRCSASFLWSSSPWLLLLSIAPFFSETLVRSSVETEPPRPRVFLFFLPPIAHRKPSDAL